MAVKSRFAAILLLDCPSCLDGAMFRTLLTMYDKCTVCGHRFMREPGYFQGAMYVSYVLGIGTFVALWYGCQALFARDIGFLGAGGVAILIQLTLVPVLFRYSRVIWAHLNIGTR